VTETKKAEAEDEGDAEETRAAKRKRGPGITDGEQKAWLAGLREGWLSSEAQRELSLILERQWFPQRRGRRADGEKTSWQIANKNLKARGLSSEVKAELEKMRASGKTFKKIDAEEVVATAHSISREALLERMRGCPPPADPAYLVSTDDPGTDEARRAWVDAQRADALAKGYELGEVLLVNGRLSLAAWRADEDDADF
jgi:hypothetical protein